MDEEFKPLIRQGSQNLVSWLSLIIFIGGLCALVIIGKNNETLNLEKGFLVGFLFVVTGCALYLFDIIERDSFWESIKTLPYKDQIRKIEERNERINGLFSGGVCN